MRELVFEDFGIEVFRDDDRYSIRYDAGEIVEVPREVSVTFEQAEKAMRSEQDAYEVLIAIP